MKNTKIFAALGFAIVASIWFFSGNQKKTIQMKTGQNLSIHKFDEEVVPTQSQNLDSKSNLTSRTRDSGQEESRSFASVANQNENNKSAPVSGKIYKLAVNDNLNEPPDDIKKEVFEQQAKYLEETKNARLIGEAMVVCVAETSACEGPVNSNGSCITRRNLCKDPSQATVVSENYLVQTLGAKKAESYRMKMQILEAKGVSREM